MKAKDLLLLQNYPSVLIYGPSGCGKTALASQAKNSYMLDFDSGMRTSALLQDNFTSLRQDCEFDTYVDTNPAAPNAFLRAEAKLEELQKLSASGKLEYDCIIIDSLTGLTKCMQLQIMSLAGGSFKQPQIQHWGQLVNAVEKVLTILRSLKCMLIVTAHEMSFEVDGTNLVRPLSITEKHSKNKLMWLFDEVWHMKLKPVGMNKHKHIISSSSTTSIAARTRSGISSEIDITDSGLEALLTKIGYKKGDDSARQKKI